MQYQVLVGNVGQVYSGDSFGTAVRVFLEYKEQSLSGRGRAGNESVHLLEDGEPIKEHLVESQD